MFVGAKLKYDTAEAWRLNPAFKQDEVTITRLGVWNI
jgi:hypothetical protein